MAGIPMGCRFLFLVKLPSDILFTAKDAKDAKEKQERGKEICDETQRNCSWTCIANSCPRPAQINNSFCCPDDSIASDISFKSSVKSLLVKNRHRLASK